MKKRIALIALLCVGVYALLLIVLYLTDCMEISTKEEGNCISVAFFEKQKLAGVDRVVISDLRSEKQITITDNELVREVVEETTIATHIWISVCESVRIDLYDGDKLVRSMTGDIDTGTIIVYREDFFHWIHAPGFGNDGMVCLPHDLTMTLRTLWLQ